MTKTESIDFSKADYDYFLWLANELKLGYNAVPLTSGGWRITVPAGQFHLIKDIGKGLRPVAKPLGVEAMKGKLADLNGWLATNRPKCGPYETYSIGKTFAKIASHSCGQTSVHCFVAMVDGHNKALGSFKQGHIFKPASWNAPAKHSRGELLEPGTWEACFGEWGVNYLR